VIRAFDAGRPHTPGPVATRFGVRGSAIYHTARHLRLICDKYGVSDGMS
jgi:hypothetical protein